MQKIIGDGSIGLAPLILGNQQSQPSSASSLITTPQLKFKTGFFSSVNLPTVSLVGHKPTFDFIHNILINHNSIQEPEINLPENIDQALQQCTFEEQIATIALTTADALNIAISKTPSVFTYGDIVGIPGFYDGNSQVLFSQLDTLANKVDNSENKDKISAYKKQLSPILDKLITPKVDMGGFLMEQGLKLKDFPAHK